MFEMSPPVNDVNQNPASQAIDRALQANLKLQSDLMSRIQKISDKKAQNRNLAAKTTAMIGYLWSKEYSQNARPYQSMSHEFYTKFSKRLREEYEKEQPSDNFQSILYSKDLEPLRKRKKFKRIHHCENKSDGGNAAKEKETTNDLNHKNSINDNQYLQKDAKITKSLKHTWKTPKKCQYAWGYDDNRRWYRRFFVDPAATVPKENSDTLKRRALEKEIPFKQLLYSWSTSEIKQLKKITEKVRTEMENDNKSTCSENVEERKSSKESIISQNEGDINITPKLRLSDSMIDFAKVCKQSKLQRTPDECRKMFLSCVSAARNTLPFTRSESIKMMELVQKNDGRVSWDIVAKSLGNNRMPYQCFQHFLTKLDTSRFQIQWTKDEDELLLRYIAACGPQFLLNLRSAADMSIRLFPKRSTSQILVRAHHTLVNPKYMYDKWSEDEERMLAMSIRVYCNASSPQKLSARHFPNRASKMVMEKWCRCLDPGFSSQPFTEAEDTALINAVKEAGDTFEWKDIAKLFPSRRIPALKRRWIEVAKTDDLIKNHGTAIKKRLARHGVVGKKSLLHPDDIILCKKKK